MSLFEDLIDKYCDRLHELIAFRVIRLDDVVKCAMDTSNAKVLYFLLDEFKPNTKEFRTIKNKLLTTHKVEYIYYMVESFYKDFTLIELNECAEALISENDGIYNAGEYITKFAINIPDAPIAILTDAIISLNRAIDIYNFANKINYSEYVKLGEDELEKLSDAMCKTLDASLIFDFAKNIPGANKYKLSLAMAKTLNQEYIYKFASVVGGDIEALTEAFRKTLYTTKNREYVFQYCFNMNAVVLIDDLIKLEDYENIYKLALEIVDDGWLEKIINLFKEKGYNKYIYSLALNREYIRKFLLKRYGDTYSDLIKDINNKISKQRAKNLENEQIKNGTYQLSKLSQDGLKQILYKLINQSNFYGIKDNREYFSPFLIYNAELTNGAELKREIKK